MRRRELLTRQGYAAQAPRSAGSDERPPDHRWLVCFVNGALTIATHATNRLRPRGLPADTSPALTRRLTAHVPCPHGQGPPSHHPQASGDGSTGAVLRAEAATMNDLLVARLSAQGGLVTAVEAYSCGYTNVSLHRLVDSGDLFRARSGCFVDGRLLTGASTETRHALMARAVSRGYRQPHAISHVSALVVHGLPLLNFTADVVHLTLTGPGFPRTLRGLRVHPERRTRSRGAMTVAVSCTLPWPSSSRRHSSA